MKTRLLLTYGLFLLTLLFCKIQTNAQEISSVVNNNTSEDIIKIRQSIRLHPNPSTDFIRVSGLNKNYNYTVYNVLGKEVLKGNTKANIDVKNLTKGVYLLKLEGLKVVKFIKD